MNLLQIHPFHMSSQCVYHTAFMCPRDDERGEQLEIWINQPTKMHLDEASLNSQSLVLKLLTMILFWLEQDCAD